MMSQLDSRYPMLISSRLAGRAVDVLVGEEKEIFSVHEKLIRTSSPFFDKATSGAWLESAQHTIRLPEDEPEIFSIYVHWLYYGTFPVYCDKPGRPANQEYLKLVKAYTLGDKLMDTVFQNAAIDAIVEKSTSMASDGHKWYPDTEVVEFAYNNTNKSAPIRQLLVDMYVSVGHSEWLDDENPDSVPQPFLFELSSKLLDLRGGARPEIKASNYHIHASVDVKTEPEKGNS